MTANQMAYLQYQEQARANQAQEALKQTGLEQDRERYLLQHGIDVEKLLHDAQNIALAERKQDHAESVYDNEAYLRNLSALNSLAGTGEKVVKSIDTGVGTVGKVLNGPFMQTLSNIGNLAGSTKDAFGLILDIAGLVPFL